MEKYNCSCGEVRYKKSAYCYDCYMIYTKNQTLRKMTKSNYPKFEKLSEYIKEMELKGCFELQDINQIINMYQDFYGEEFNYLDRSVSYMWKSIKKLNEKYINNSSEKIKKIKD